jgi:1-phosphofructokinase family hexose kinase
MQMILTVTLNPAIDKTYYVDDITLGQEVIRVNEMIKTAGGGGINVAKALKIFNQNALATGLLGGESGEYILSFLKKANIPSNFTIISDDTRTCTSIIEKTGGRHTRLLEKGPEITTKELDDFLCLYTDLIKLSQIIVLSGSVAKNIETNIYAKLIKIAKDHNRVVVLDTYKNYLSEGIDAIPNIIKPNREELCTYLCKNITSVEESVGAGKNLVAKGIETVIISLGADGAAFVTQNEAIVCKPPVVPTVNYVGCGDTLVAGYVYGLVNGLSVKDSAGIAVASSAANVESADIANFNLVRMNEILSQVQFTDYF